MEDFAAPTSMWQPHTSISKTKWRITKKCEIVLTRLTDKRGWIEVAERCMQGCNILRKKITDIKFLFVFKTLQRPNPLNGQNMAIQKVLSGNIPAATISAVSTTTDLATICKSIVCWMLMTKPNLHEETMSVVGLVGQIKTSCVF